MKKLGEYLLANNMRAAIVALLCTLLPLVELPGGFIAAIIVGLVTLRKGSKAGLYVLAFVALPAISLLVLRRFEYGLFDILLARCILVWIFALVLRRWNSWIFVLEIMAVIGAIAVLLVHAIVPDIKLVLTNVLTQAYKNFALSGALQIPSNKAAEYIQQLVPFATGSAAFLLFFGVFLQLLLARWWQSIIFLPGGFRQEFVQIRVDRIASILLVVATVGMYWHPAWLMDLYPVLLLPFMVAGLSIVHYLTSKRKQMVILVIAMYIALIIFNFLTVAVLGLIGFVDSWIHFRRKRQLA